MRRCCGEERPSNFCPECGKQLMTEDSLPGLLAYLRSQLLVRNTEVRRALADAQGAPDNPGLQRYANKKQKLAAKWESWVSKLVSLLEHTGW